MLASCEPEKARMEHRRLCSLCFLPYPFLLPEANGMEFEQVRERELGRDRWTSGRCWSDECGWRRARLKGGNGYLFECQIFGYFSSIMDK
jgi:hypothetical protein